MEKFNNWDASFLILMHNNSVMAISPAA